MPVKPKHLPEPFRSDHRSRYRQYLVSLLVLAGAAVFFLLAEKLPLAAIVGALLLAVVVIGAVWVGAPARQFEKLQRDELRRPR